MYTESSAGYGGFDASAEFEFGSAILPYWPEITGYLPITEAAYELAKEQGLYEETPALEALDDAVRRGNEVLREFARANR